MNHLESLRILVTNRKGNLPAQIREFLKSAPDYREIEKVECFPYAPYSALWDIHINGKVVGSPIYGAAYAKQVADWLHDNRALFNLILPK